MKGLFITIEGIDGSGKTTLATNLVALLSRKGYPVIQTQEPTKGRIGELLRTYLQEAKIPPGVDALLFAADRVEHWKELILPSLEQGRIVVSDRHKLSSLAYQSAQGLEMDWILEINTLVPDPDLIIYLDIPIDTALERINKKSQLEKFEVRNELEKIQKHYQRALSKTKSRIICLDSTLSPEDLTNKAFNEILPYLPSLSR